MIGKNSKYVLTALAAALVVGIIFALMPVQKASTVHTSITGASQVDFDDQERAVAFEIATDHGITAIADAVLVPDKNVDLTGRIEAVVLILTDGMTAGTPNISFECVNGAGGAVAVGGALAAVNAKTSAALPADCEAIRFDAGAGGDATDDITALVTIYIDNWPEV